MEPEIAVRDDRWLPFERGMYVSRAIGDAAEAAVTQFAELADYTALPCGSAASLGAAELVERIARAVHARNVSAFGFG